MAKRTSADLRIVLLNEGHERGGFTCGVESLDRYLKTQAGQDVRRKANAVFVLSGRAGARTRLLHALRDGDLSGRSARGGAQAHPALSTGERNVDRSPAISKDRQGQHLGAVFADALQRAFESASTVGSSMVVVGTVSV